MPLSDKNIIITPNIGSTTTDPNVRFISGDTSTSATITLRVLNSGTIGTLSFEGSAGQLFSISDSLSGSIFSVNDISGIPSIEVFDTGEVRLAQYNGFVDILNSTSATSTNSGALQVVGGVGIGGNLYVGGEIIANKLTIQLTTVTTTLIDTDDIIRTSNTTNATSTTTGALQVAGGAGIGGNLFVGGNINSAGTSVINYSTTTNVNSGTYVTPRFQAYSEIVTTLASTTAAQNLNLALSNIFDVTLTTNTTFTFTNPVASGAAMPVTVILRQGTGGNFTATFTNAKYSDGIVPVLSTGAGQVDVLSFFTVNGGSFWFGTFAMANVS
jgi:hypothetical protein